MNIENQSLIASASSPVKKVRMRVTILSHGIILAVFSLLRLPPHLQQAAIWLNRFFTFDYSFKIDAMAAGAIGAYLVISRKNQVLEILFSKSFQYLTYGTLAVLLIFPQLFAYQFYNVVFLSVIINVSFNPDTIVRFENKITNYLGKISYGIYMYHFLFYTFIVKWCMESLHIRQSFANELLICMVCLLASIAVSSFSFHFIELPILKIKDRVIKSKSQHTP